MGSDQHPTPRKMKIICVLCNKSDETEITGALSSKNDISAHQNCLTCMTFYPSQNTKKLYASGIYCKNSPTYDDLFGFNVHDVKQEVRRGRKLICHHCQKRGATAGCEVNRCKRSYHYPCANEANARVIEDLTEDRFILYCEKHDPQSKRASSEISDVPSPSGLNLSTRGSPDSRGRRPVRRESNSSTGASEQGNTSKSKNTATPNNPDEEVQLTCIDPIFAPVESDLDDSTPPKQHNSIPTAQGERQSEKLNLPSTGLVYAASASHLNGCQSDIPRQHNKRAESESPIASSPETPRRKKNRFSVLDSDDELETSTYSVAVPHAWGCTSPTQQNHSTPLSENKRASEGLNSLPTGDDGDDTDIDSDVSQSLLPSGPYNFTVQCTVIMDSGPSMESENSLDPRSPSRAVTADVCTSPGSVAPKPELEDTTSTNITTPEPKAPNTEPAFPDSADHMPQQERSESGPTDQSQSPTSDFPEALPSAIQPLLATHITTDHPEERSPLEAASASPHHPGTTDANDVDAMMSFESSAATFWAKCNEAGCTEEIFSELVSQLNSLRERIQSQEATQQDFDVALKVLEASGRLPTIITQLEQDLEKQERELRRKMAALRDARAVLRFSLN